MVTETRKGIPGSPEIIEFAAESGARYTPRQDRSLVRILADENASGVIVWEPEGPVLYQGKERFFYHPSMGKNRVSRLRRGESDPIIEAMELKAGMEVLDCTLGLGADALVISFVVGKEGRVWGLESSPITAAIVRWGMKKYPDGPQWLKEAMDRIEITCADYLAELRGLPDNSFDIVYFDPMFRQPVQSSKPIAPLRQLANHQPLSVEAVSEAIRVSRKRVVLKERHDSTEFERLGFIEVVMGNHSEIAYGVMEVSD
ncbi:MAG: class I SAM-dependent methyltransferase [Syntrophomonadales bacterium]